MVDPLNTPVPPKERLAPHPAGPGPANSEDVYQNSLPPTTLSALKTTSGAPPSGLACLSQPNLPPAPPSLPRSLEKANVRPRSSALRKFPSPKCAPSVMTLAPFLLPLDSRPTTNALTPPASSNHAEDVHPSVRARIALPFLVSGTLLAPADNAKSHHAHLASLFQKLKVAASPTNFSYSQIADTDSLFSLLLPPYRSLFLLFMAASGAECYQTYFLDGHSASHLR